MGTNIEDRSKSGESSIQHDRKINVIEPERFQHQF